MGECAYPLYKSSWQSDWTSVTEVCQAIELELTYTATITPYVLSLGEKFAALMVPIEEVFIPVLIRA